MTTGKLFEYKTCAPSGGYAAFAREWVLLPVDHARLAQRQHAPVMTWLGPVSMLLQVGGLNILLDHAGRLCWALWPLWRTAPGTPAPLAPEELPPIDVVLISHNHYDHLCDDTIGRLLAAGHQPRFFVPLGLKPWFDTRNIAQLTELDWWDRAQINDGLQLHFTPSQHWSRRTPWDTNASLWGGYLLEWTLEEAEPWRFLFPGDTGYSADFKAIRSRLGAVDFLALPIGVYLPRDFMKTCTSTRPMRRS